ncbi:MAG: sulfotransferase [Myxococcales bacterium]|nr:sulfotransferase [Myxococcales bacterium]
MSWQAPERPQWVAAINAGGVAPISEEAQLPLARDALLGTARARLGLPDAGIEDFCHPALDGDSFLEPLDLVLGALEREAELNVMGRWLTRRFLLRVLEGRLQLVRYLHEDPGVCDEPIEKPLFVTGAPRTGTTILYALLARDANHRVPEGWELLRPVPPPDPDPARFAADPRIALADRELRMPQTVVSDLLSIHPYGGRMPKECLSAMTFSFRSEEFTARYHVPSYEAWLQACDMRPAYAMHRLVLQILQRRGRPAQWALKSPVHLHSLQALLSVYPDAQIAVTHRDPLKVLASLTSLIAVLRWAHSDRVDYAQLGAAHAQRYGASLDRLAVETQGGDLPSARMHHGRYADFLDDPLAATGRLYERFERPFPPALQEAMRETLAAPKQGERGEHDYAFEDLGLDRSAERARFRRYQQHFEVPDEA